MNPICIRWLVTERANRYGYPASCTRWLEVADRSRKNREGVTDSAFPPDGRGRHGVETRESSQTLSSQTLPAQAPWTLRLIFGR